MGKLDKVPHPLRAIHVSVLHDFAKPDPGPVEEQKVFAFKL